MAEEVIDVRRDEIANVINNLDDMTTDEAVTAILAIVDAGKPCDEKAARRC